MVSRRSADRLALVPRTKALGDQVPFVGRWAGAARSACLCPVERAVDIGLNWRDPDAYACLLDADPTFFAWEWLRRDTTYRTVAKNAVTSGSRRADHAAERFGLVRFEDADVPVPHARPLWRSEVNPQVLVADLSAGDRAEDVLELDRFSHLVHLVAKKQDAHLLLTDGLRAIRLDAPLSAIETGGVRLCFRIDGIHVSKFSVLALRRLLALAHCGRFARTLHRREPRARRWILQLRAHDALASGADLREIAAELLGRPTADTRWRTRDPSLRSQAQRVVRSARAQAKGGFHQLLRA